MKRLCLWLFLLIFLLHGGKASAYCLQGDACPQSATGWPSASATFQTQGFSGSNSAFDAAFADALTRWNNLSSFSYSGNATAVDPCVGPNGTKGTNDTRSWTFSADNCGDAFGGATLAVTTTWANTFSPAIDTIVDADIVFNTAFTFDVHNGPGPDKDFTRVAAHELGHALGLDHDNTLPALMNTFYSDTIETPQTDDINGIKALYGSGSSTTTTPTSPTTTAPTPDIKANSGDAQLTVTSNDTLSVAITLDPGSSSGTGADWWIAAKVSGSTSWDGWYYYNLSKWVGVGSSATGLVVTHQGSLFTLGSFSLLNSVAANLQTGTYTFYFAVETNMDGVLDTGDASFVFDSIVVNVTQ